MHELALAENVLEIVQAAARERAANRVTAIRLVVGTLSCVDPAALRFCFDAVTRGSLAEGARLTIDTPGGEAWCMACCRPVPLAALGEPCPLCGGYQLHVTRGDALQVADIDIA